MEKAAASDAIGGWCRLVALGLATIFVLCAVAAVLIAYRGSVAPDFLSFWAAGRLVADGQPALVYDIVRHHAVEASAVPSVSLLPFPYPPFALPLFVPFGILPFWIALAAWLVLTAALLPCRDPAWIEVRFSLAQAAAAREFHHRPEWLPFFRYLHFRDQAARFAAVPCRRGPRPAELQAATLVSFFHSRFLPGANGGQLEEESRHHLRCLAWGCCCLALRVIRASSRSFRNFRNG